MPDKFNELLLKQDIIELYNAGITPDYGYLMNGRFEKDMIKTMYPLKTLSGNPISWEASDTEYLFPVVSLEPKQAGSGDPSPDNVRPISGYDSVTVNVRGKNLVDYTKAQPRNNSQTVEIIPNGVKWSGDYYFKIPITGLPKGSTIVFSCTTEIKINWCIRYADNSLGYKASNGKPLTLDQNKTTKELYIYTSPPEQPVTDAIFTNIQLEFGSTPTPYEPYQGETSTLTLPETIYGGTVDAVTGAGEKTWAFVEFDGSEDENWKKANSSGRVYFSINIKPYGLVSDAEHVTWKCNRLVPCMYNYSATVYPEYSIGFTSTKITCSIVLENESMLSVDEFKAWLAENPVTLCYELDTPTPFQATGNQALTIQPGNHTIYTDGNNISLSRKARRLEV